MSVSLGAGQLTALPKSDSRIRGAICWLMKERGIGKRDGKGKGGKVRKTPHEINITGCGLEASCIPAP